MFERAARMGSAEVKYALAQQLFHGIGCLVNQPRARQLLAEAAKAGLMHAKLHLALMTENGQGGPSDPVKAAGLCLALVRGMHRNHQVREAANRGLVRLELGGWLTSPPMDEQMAQLNAALRAEFSS